MPSTFLIFVTASLSIWILLHITLPTTFNLVVDDFVVKVIGQTHADHLIHSLQSSTNMTINSDGKIFCGIHLDWNYKNRTVDLSMPDYVTKALAQIHHLPPKKPQHSPHPYSTPVYGQKQQYTKPTTKTCQLTPAQVKLCQAFAGLFNYYAHAINNTMQTAVSSIVSCVSTCFGKTSISASTSFLIMPPLIPMLASYTKPLKCTSGFTLMLHISMNLKHAPVTVAITISPTLPISPDDPPLPHNAPILVNSKIIDAVMSSVQESETGSGFINAKYAVPIHTILQEMGHPQGPTPLQFNNK
jgi:hypothetical protein